MFDATLLYRSAVLRIAHNRSIQHLVTTRGWSFASRFVAGVRVEEAIEAIDALEKEGIHGILDLLGEMVSSEEEVTSFTEKIKEQIRAFAALPHPRYISIKLSQIGLDLDDRRMLDAAREIVSDARDSDCFIRIDMEDSPRVERTLDTYRVLRNEGFENVGVVLQSYLRRTANDLDALLPLSPSIRVVKGAYKEPASVAFQDKSRVDAGFLALARKNLKAGNRTALATHDERIINEMKTWLAREDVDPEIVEFQMLYGIRRDLQRALASEGYRVRAYVPFGSDWYPYFSRRIAERPANALFVAKAMLKG